MKHFICVSSSDVIKCFENPLFLFKVANPLVCLVVYCQKHIKEMYSLLCSVKAQMFAWTFLYSELCSLTATVLDHLHMWVGSGCFLCMARDASSWLHFYITMGTERLGLSNSAKSCNINHSVPEAMAHTA
jgi:hypothetical protein